MTFLRYTNCSEKWLERSEVLSSFIILWIKMKDFPNSPNETEESEIDELSFYYFFVLSQLSVEKEELVKKCSHTSIVFIFADYQDWSVSSFWQNLSSLWHWWWSLVLYLLHYSSPPYIDLICYILCNRKTRSHPPQQSSPTTCNGFMMGGDVSPAVKEFYAFVVIFMSTAQPSSLQRQGRNLEIIGKKSKSNSLL